MNLFSLAIGFVLLITLLVFSLYAYLAVRHATRFRYLSKRMLILTLLFIVSTTILIGLLLVSYGFFVLQ
jgi:hypothetical protein